MAEMQAPRFIKEVISCCTVDYHTRQRLSDLSLDTRTSIPYPKGLVGSSYPNTIRNPGIACKPPTAAVSMPYCMLAIATAEHMSKHFRFAQSVLSFNSVMAIIQITTQSLRKVARESPRKHATPKNDKL
jgi:hypothetical protein